VEPVSLTVIRYTQLWPFLVRCNDTGGSVAALVPSPTSGRRRGANGRAPGTDSSHALGTAIELGGGFGARPSVALESARQDRVRHGGRMPRRIYDFEVPERFVAGTVGRPGSRTFFLQAKKGNALISVVLEKVQVQVLAERTALLLAEVGRRGVAVPEAIPPGADDVRPLDEPLVEAFRVGTLTLGWDAERGQVVLEARAQVEDVEDEAAAAELPDDDPDGPDLVRVRLAPGEARAFVERALQIVAAGRPPCPICGRPLDPGGHICPRRNGYVH